MVTFMKSTMHPGDILLGKYRVERVLGQGGMGIVVAVRHVHLGELFALKMLLPEAVSNSVAIERFLREARAAARLKGEHVARVHDVGSFENGAPFMVMEHLNGQDLKKLIKSRGTLPLEEAALYIYQACEAVAEAHANGIVHRDLKPANLFLTRRPNGQPCIKVLDFGISKELDAGNSLSSDLTRTGAFMGSPLYMSPEQMANIKTTDIRSDIWALGVILYELVLGQVPFSAQAVTELVMKVLTSTAVPPSHLRPEIPLAFDALVLRCLERRLEYRFQSVSELMQHLLPYATRSVQPAPVSTAPLPSLSSGYAIAPPSQSGSLPQFAMVEESTTVMPLPPPAASTNALPIQSIEALVQNGLSVQQGVTVGAWDTTGKGPERRDRTTLVLGGIALAALAVLGGLYMATTSGTDDSSAKAESTKATAPAAMPRPSAVAPQQTVPPIVIPATANPEMPKVDPVESAVPTTPTNVPSTPPEQTAAPVKTSAPATTKPRTKKPTIADFND